VTCVCVCVCVCVCAFIALSSSASHAHAHSLSHSHSHPHPHSQVTLLVLIRVITRTRRWARALDCLVEGPGQVWERERAERREKLCEAVLNVCGSSLASREGCCGQRVLRRSEGSSRRAWDGDGRSFPAMTPLYKLNIFYALCITRCTRPRTAAGAGSAAAAFVGRRDQLLGKCAHEQTGRLTETVTRARAVQVMEQPSEADYVIPRGRFTCCRTGLRPRYRQREEEKRERQSAAARRERGELGRERGA
jgi:hypothetical protein